MAITIRDRDIVTKSFRLLSRGVLPSEILDQLDWDRYFNVFSSAIGDNRYVNPAAQFSPATDPRYGRMMTTREGGMGSMYKEMYEDNVTLLTLTPGVAQFAGLLSFITNMFNPAAAIIANKGRAPGLSFYMAQGITSVAFWPMQLVAIGVQFLAFLANSPKNNFWTIKPTVATYIMAGNGVLNDCMVRLGYIDPVLPKRTQEQNDPLYGLKPDYDNSKSVQDLSLLFPDVVNKDGTIDLMRLVMKGTRKHRTMIKRLAELDNDTSITTVDQKFDREKQLMEEVTFDQTVIAGEPSQAYVVREMNTVGKYRGDEEGSHIEQDSAYLNQPAYDNISNSDQGLGGVDVNAYNAQQQARTAENPLQTGDTSTTPNMGSDSSFGTSTAPTNPNDQVGRPQPASQISTAPTPEVINYEENPETMSWAGEVFDLLQTAFAGGLDGITFRVEDATGAVTDSFSNSHSPSPMASKFNSIVKAANDFRFDIAGGATGIGIIDSIVDTFKEAGIGALSGSVIGNIPLALANNSYIKIADHWDGSTSSLHKESYTIYSHCNYAHPYEQIMKIWVPFALLLPLVAPFSSGGASYTSPFMVKAFCQSRQIIRNGMVESMSFTFGEGEGGWTKDRKPLNFKATLSIVDLEPLISVPIDRSTSILDLTNPNKLVSTILNDDTAYNNYLGRLTGISFLDTILKYSQVNRNMTNMVLDIKQSVSARNIAAKVADSIVGDFGRLFYKPLAR